MVLRGSAYSPWVHRLWPSGDGAWGRWGCSSHGGPEAESKVGINLQLPSCNTTKDKTSMLWGNCKGSNCNNCCSFIFSVLTNIDATDAILSLLDVASKGKAQTMADGGLYLQSQHLEAWGKRIVICVHMQICVSVHVCVRVHVCVSACVVWTSEDSLMFKSPPTSFGRGPLVMVFSTVHAGIAGLTFGLWLLVTHLSVPPISWLGHSGITDTCITVSRGDHKSEDNLS